MPYDVEPGVQVFVVQLCGVDGGVSGVLHSGGRGSGVPNEVGVEQCVHGAEHEGKEFPLAGKSVSVMALR